MRQRVDHVAAPRGTQSRSPPPAGQSERREGASGLPTCLDRPTGLVYGHAQGVLMVRSSPRKIAVLPTLIAALLATLWLSALPVPGSAQATAVRMGALNLAVGDIIGGNAFDTLFVAASDIAYRQGPIYAAVSSAERFWLAISMTMTSVLLMGLIYRERHGPGNIGLESVILLALYVGAVLSLAVAF